MSRTLLVVVAAITVTLSPLTTNAQTAAKPPQPAAKPAQAAAGQPAPKGRVRQEPCWHQVGISQSAMQQRDQIVRERHEQVEAVCADSSLTQQQKQQKIKEIRQQAKEKMDAAVTPEQEEQLHACQKERAGNGGHPSTPAVHHGGTGPCGEVASSGAPHPPRGGDGDPPHEDEPAAQ